MLTLWFYRDSRPALRRMLSRHPRQRWAHVAVSHTVQDLWVVSEAHPSRGIWCTPATRVAKPAVQFGVPVDDPRWVGEWMVKHYGQRYGIRDLFHFVSPAYDPRVLEASPRSSAELVVALCQEARNRGNQHAVVQHIADARGATPDRLFAICNEFGLHAS